MTGARSVLWKSTDRFGMRSYDADLSWFWAGWIRAFPYLAAVQPTSTEALSMSFLNGHLLIANPRMLDSFFTKSVILLLAHSAEGAAGIVLNRPTEATVSDLSGSIFQGSFSWDKPISLGGPVSGPLVLLHQEAQHADHEVITGVYSTVEDIKVRQVLKNRIDPSVVAINYSGWGPGQLENELREDSWEVLPASAELVFPEEAIDLWKSALQQVQSRKLFSLVNLREVPKNPSWN